MIVRTSFLFGVAALALVACGKKDEAPAAKPAPAPAEAAKPAPVPADKPVTPPPAPAPAALDAAAFVPVDLSSVKALANVTAKAPAGATVTPDDPSFNETEPDGAVIAHGDFALHLRRGTVGGERTALPIMAQMEEAKYAELTSNEKLVDYTFEKAGTLRYGFVRPIDGFNERGEQLLCGPAKPLATADALTIYRQACDQVGKK